MKRLLAIVGLLALCVGPVTADYLFIKLDLKKVNFAGGGGGASQPGGGLPGGGEGGGGAGRGGAGFAQPGGAGFGQPGGGVQGSSTTPGGQPGGGLPGYGQPGGGQPGMEGTDFGTHIVMAVIELKSKADYVQQTPQEQQAQAPRVVQADHKFGLKGRFPIIPDKVEYTLVKKDSPGKEFTKRFSKDLVDAKDAGRLYAAASWAFGHGLTKNFHEAMGLLTKVDPKHFAAVAYARVNADKKKMPADDDPANLGIVNLLKGEFKLVTSDHYGILTKEIAPQYQPSLKRRLARFEETFDNFYYWFALQENVPQPAVPKQRLYVLLADDKQSFHERHAWWGAPPMATDAFTPRRDNLVVLSARRLDDNFVIFEANNKTLMANSTLSREELISGAIWNRAENKNRVLEVSAYQTLALVQKAMEDEAERAAISHEAIRQLLTASGLLPRTVNVPEWMQSGMSSYFDTPYCSLYPGVGLPNWSELVALKYYYKTKKFGGVTPLEKVDALTRTVTDRYFREAVRTEQDQKELAEKDKQELDKTKEQHEIARCTAWAFTYFLLETKKMPQLLQYAQELANLPRDLEFDDRTLLACFGRAFNMSDPKDARRLDPNKARALADEWFEFFQQRNLEVPEAENIFMAYRYPTRRPGAANPNQPGGSPMLTPPGTTPGLVAPGARN